VSGARGIRGSLPSELDGRHRPAFNLALVSADFERGFGTLLRKLTAIMAAAASATASASTLAMS
jgi:hypothetical protein